MKTRASVFCLLAFLCTIGHGVCQTRKTSIGIALGPSLVSLRGNAVIDSYHKTTIGASAGFFFQYNFDETFSVRTDMAFERKGSRYTFTLTDQAGIMVGTVSRRVIMNYLTVPVLFRATFGQNIRYFVNAGPFAGYMLKAATADPNFGVFDAGGFKPMDGGISGGVGVSFPVSGKAVFSIEARHNLGLYNISTRPVTGGGTINSSATVLLLGLGF